MSQIMGLPADKLLEDYTPGEKMAYTFNSGYRAAITDALREVNEVSEVIRARDACLAPQAFGAINAIRNRIQALTEDKE